MLVLTRRKDQRIVIGDDIVVTVLEVKGDSVRLGVEAPRSVQVHREEVYRALVEANRQAVLPPTPPTGLPSAARPAAGVRPAPPGRPVPRPPANPGPTPAS